MKRVGMNRPIRAAVLATLTTICSCFALHTQASPSREWHIYNQSTAIVEATVLRIDLLARPERMGRWLDVDGFMKPPNPHEYLAGYAYVLRVTDVVKSNGLLAVGSDALVPTDMALDELFWAQDGERVLVALQFVWGTSDEAKLKGTKRISRSPRPASLDPIDLPDTDLTHVYRVYSKFHIKAMRDYEAYKDLLRAQSKPVVWIAQPAADATLQGTVTLRAEGYDDSAITSVQFYLDGAPIGPEVTDVWRRLTWRSKDVANGPHVLTVLARDSTGEETLSEPITVTTQNANTAPVVGAWPPTGSGFASPFTWNWSDADGDPLTCVFTVVEFAQCGFAGHCTEAGGASAGVTPCQARVEYGQPLFTRCTYRLACSDGWATTTAEFTLN